MTDGTALDLSGDGDAVRAALLSWYDDDRRDYPWREMTAAYPLLVCEVMSQQTQLDRVVEPWTAFLERWPDLEALAEADRADVVGFWSNQALGYNNRARRLHEAARLVLEEHDGDLPDTVDGLETLPGVGPYTARAVASFAFGVDAAVVDTNVKRVLHRAFEVPDDEAAFRAAAEVLLPGDDARRWNEAIMELGGVVCRRTPRCDAAPCPWRDHCAAYASGDFTAPDVPDQPAFEGSRRQFRGRVVRALEAGGELPLAALGPRVRVDYVPEGEHGRAWLRDLLEDLAEDGLVEVEERADETVVRLAR